MDTDSFWKSNKLEETQCPSCNTAPDGVVKYRFGRFCTVVCRSCQLEYLTPRPTEQIMRDMYLRPTYYRNPEGSFGYVDYESDRDAITKTSLWRLERLLKFTKCGDILEVGAGFGYFLEHAAKRGFRVSGLEISDIAVTRLRERVGSVYHGDISQFGFQSAFDVIALFDTLEHIYDLCGFIRAAYAALRRHGLMFCAAPDNRSLSARLLGQRWWAYKVPEHLYYFNEDSFRTLLGGRFTLVYTETDRQFATFRTAAVRLKSVSRFVGNLATEIVRSFQIDGVAVCVPNGNRLYIARRND